MSKSDEQKLFAGSPRWSKRRKQILPPRNYVAFLKMNSPFSAGSTVQTKENRH